MITIEILGFSFPITSPESLSTSPKLSNSSKKSSKMAMAMSPTDPSTSASRNITKSSSTESSKGSNPQKPKKKKRTKRGKSGIRMILLSGRQPNPDNLLGHQNGVKDDLVGILNVLPWQQPS